MMKNVLFLLIALLSVFACNNAQTPAPQPEPMPAKVEAPPTPRPSNVIVSTARAMSEMNTNFPYDIELKTADGQTTNSAQVLKKNGKPTIVLFWLTTCIPCRYELEAIKKVYADYAKEQDFNMVAISTDFPKNYDAFVQRVNESNWPFEAYYDVNREFRNVMPGELNGLPQTFIFDAEGKIVYHKRKYRSGDEVTLFEKVKAIAMK